jgi:hypothetical protein
VKLKKKQVDSFFCYHIRSYSRVTIDSTRLAINIRNLPEDEPPDSQLMRLDNMLIAEGTHRFNNVNCSI